MSSFFPTEIWNRRASKSHSIFQYISYRRIGFFAATSDFTLILLASIASGILYHFFLFATEGHVEAFVAVGIYSGLFFILLVKSLGLYRPNALLSARSQIRGVITAWSAVLLFVTSLLFLLKSGADYSRGAMAGFGFLGFGIIIASRAIIGSNLRRALATGTLAGQRVIVIGDAEELEATSALHLLRTYGAREIGRFEFSTATDDVRSNTTHDMAVIDAGIKAAKANRAEQVLLALRWVDAPRRDLIFERLRALPLSVLLLPDRFVKSIISQTGWDFNAQPAIEVQRAPLSKKDLTIKRILDVMLAGLLLVIFSPLLMVVGLAIKLDFRGPVIFRQRRRGFNGHEFAIYKFRTMKVSEDGASVRQARRDDDRVTWLGRVLRATSIDELPQLFNVLVGEMSLVGPRPHAVAHDAEYSDSIDNYAFRHHVKPGITGWAQVHGFRGETVDIALMHKRIELDLWYINNWSFWLDLQIMARTCIVILQDRNAY